MPLCTICGSEVETLDSNERCSECLEREAQERIELQQFLASRHPKDTVSSPFRIVIIIIGVAVLAGALFFVVNYSNGPENDRMLRVKAALGDKWSQFDLGSRYRDGDGVPKNPEEAVKWYLHAAKQGHEEAQYELANRYSLGDGVFENPDEAAKWYLLAAKQGHVKAQFMIGVFYATGHGCPRDEIEAIRWLRLSAEQGYDMAQEHLGFLLYGSVDRFSPNAIEAAKWFRLAAEQGNDRAQYNLGICYLEGRGVPYNIFEAVKWLSLSAEQGNTVAQKLLQE